MANEESLSFISKFFNYLKIVFETFRLTVSLISLIITLGIGGSITGFIIKNNLFIVWGLISIVVSGFLFLFLFFKLSKNNGDVRVIKKTVTYRHFADGKSMEHTKCYTIIALKDKFDLFIDRYKWSCDKPGRCNVTLLTPYQTLIEKRIQEWNINEIHFNPVISKGQKVDIALRWDLFCEGESILFLSQIIDQPTNLLELVCFVPEEPSEIKFIHFRSGEGIETNKFQVLKDSNGNYNLATGEIRYIIKNPKLNHKYMIRWSYNK